MKEDDDDINDMEQFYNILSSVSPKGCSLQNKKGCFTYIYISTISVLIQIPEFNFFLSSILIFMCVG